VKKRQRSSSITRRRALGIVTAGGAGVIATLPRTWTRPVVDAIVVPLHAQGSAVGVVYAIVDPTPDIADGEQRDVSGFITLTFGTLGTLTYADFMAAIVDYRWIVKDSNNATFGVQTVGNYQSIFTQGFGNTSAFVTVTPTEIQLEPGTWFSLRADDSDLRSLRWINNFAGLNEWTGLVNSLTAPSPAFRYPSADTLFGNGRWVIASK